MGNAVLSGREAWKFVQCLFDDKRLIFVTEEASFESVWQRICEWTPQGSSAQTDIYLATFAIASNLTVVTFDSGFARFPDLKVEIPQ